MRRESTKLERHLPSKIFSPSRSQSRYISLSLRVKNRPLLILSFPLSLSLFLRLESEARTSRAGTESAREFRSASSRVSQRGLPIQSTGVQMPRRRRSIFVNGSALTSPGTCVTVNAHSTERCGTLSLSMTDITHSRTFRRLLRIPLW